MSCNVVVVAFLVVVVLTCSSFVNTYVITY